MKIIKTISIGCKIIRKNDLKNLANVFEEESRNCSKSPELLFVVHCLDHITFSEENIGIFGSESKIDTHVIESVSMDLNSYSDSKYITLTLASSEYARNQIAINGYDENWVQGVAGRFLDILKSIEDQDNWFLRNKKIVVNLSAIPLGIIPYELLSFFLQVFSNDTPIVPSRFLTWLDSFFISLRGDIWLLPLIKLIGYMAIGRLFSIMLYENATKLWKDVEFDIGPEHLKKEKKLRSNISVFITIVLIPILISLLFFVL